MPNIALADLLERESYTHFCCGSLPFIDPASAIEFVFGHEFVIPFWPELPEISPAELMTNRAERVMSKGWSGYAPSEALGLYALRVALLEKKESPALLKCHVAGPLSIMAYCRASGGSGPVSLSAAFELCLAQLEWQLSFLTDCGARLLMTLDEPAFAKWREYDECTQAGLLEMYNQIYVRLSEVGHYLGLHSCSAFEAELLSFPLDLYSFDLLASLAHGKSLAEICRELNSALSRGLVLAPGVFPASVSAPSDFERALQQGLDCYFDLVAGLSSAKGRQVLLAANCGHGRATHEWVEYLYADNLLSSSSQ